MHDALAGDDAAKRAEPHMHKPPFHRLHSRIKQGVGPPSKFCSYRLPNVLQFAALPSASVSFQGRVHARSFVQLFGLSVMGEMVKSLHIDDLCRNGQWFPRLHTALD
jgi:hypothetical protein